MKWVNYIAAGIRQLLRFIIGPILIACGISYCYEYGINTAWKATVESAFLLFGVIITFGIEILEGLETKWFSVDT